MRNTAIERRDLLHNPLPLMPEFQRSIRLLGRRPTTQQFIDTIIKKYGTHLLISATLGGRWHPGWGWAGGLWGHWAVLEMCPLWHGAPGVGPAGICREGKLRELGLFSLQKR